MNCFCRFHRTNQNWQLGCRINYGKKHNWALLTRLISCIPWLQAHQLESAYQHVDGLISEVKINEQLIKLFGLVFQWIQPHPSCNPPFTDWFIYVQLRECREYVILYKFQNFWKSSSSSRKKKSLQAVSSRNLKSVFPPLFCIFISANCLSVLSLCWTAIYNVGAMCKRRNLFFIGNETIFWNAHWFYTNFYALTQLFVFYLLFMNASLHLVYKTVEELGIFVSMKLSKATGPLVCN